MPYYHNECGGMVAWRPFLPVRPKCQICGKTWSPLVVYKSHVDDMTYVYEGFTVKLEKGDTSYAAWADSPNTPPGVTYVASNLPNWPRKWRFISFFGTIALLSGAFYGLYLIGFWAVIIGAIVFALLPFVIVISIAIITKRG